ncbi:hypothetical protein TNCV_3839741 [Trichonephila clavipes]|nr:hypothetical protein TNCV_3839741 [Trichonephila clavipes]
MTQNTKSLGKPWETLTSMGPISRPLERAEAIARFCLATRNEFWDIENASNFQQSLTNGHALSLRHSTIHSPRHYTGFKSFWSVIIDVCRLLEALSPYAKVDPNYDP